jgi:hypothetical protein
MLSMLSPHWTSTIYISCGLRIATFLESSTVLDGCTALEKKCSQLQLSIHLSFSPNITIEVVCLSQTSVDGRLLGLLGPYHQYAISTFNTCLRGPTHRSLTNTGGGYNLGGASLPHHTLWPSQLRVLCFPPKGPVRSQVVHLIITKLKRRGNIP